jgi:2,5-diamino-6-(ribosylamino)-4(3H)-pyrimidinone 5'-phosphate reductase
LQPWPLLRKALIRAAKTSHTAGTLCAIPLDTICKNDVKIYKENFMEKPLTTLFMLMSVDGKISTGSIEDRDVDKDFPKITGIKEGLKQYYDIEKTTDLFSLNSGKVMEKVGSNIKKENVQKTDVSFIIIDNKPHLNNIGIEYFLKLSKTFYLVTNNKGHPVFQYKREKNLCIIYHEKKINFQNLFQQLKIKHRIDSMTIQTGGTLNSILLREGLIDKISIVIAPALIGGKETPTLIDGESLQTFDDLKKIRPLKLIDIVRLNDSYINIKYEIINETRIE